MHPLTWLIWLAAALVTALATRNPLYLTVVILAAAAVRAAWRGHSAAALGWGVIIRLGLMLWGVTALFDALMAHQGATVLFELPGRWPLVGGPITLESVVFGLISGLALTTLLIIFATFNSTVSHHRLLRLIPGFLHQAGMIVSVALIFVPQMTAALSDIREAQRLRGHRFRGIRDLLPLIVPLIGSGLERAVGLAEAMEARAFALPAPADRGWRAVLRRLAVLLCVLAVMSGLFVTRYWPRRALVGWMAVFLGSAVFVAILWRGGSSGKRTRYRSLRLGWNDGLVMATAGVALTVIGGSALLRPAALVYNPYPQASLPPFNPLIGMAILLLTMPALAGNHEAEDRTGERERSPAPPLLRSSAPPHNKSRPIIDMRDVTYRYPDSREPVLTELTLSIAAGSFVLVVGPSGAGKSTFLRLLNGLVPHFAGGAFSGSLRVAGRDPIALGTGGMADAVGFVFQDPKAQFVVDRVEDELVFALENLGYSRAEMERRLAWVLDLLDLHALRYRRVDTLSGGERQRVAIGAVLALQPRILVLDEPTSQLDPAGADDLLAAVTELNRRLGLTVVLAEHRLERVLPYADRIIYFSGEGQPPVVGRPREIMREADLVPPVVELARNQGWRPLPLTVEEARRHLDAPGVLRSPAHDGTGNGELRGTRGGLRGTGVKGVGRAKPSSENSRRSSTILRVSDLGCAYDGSDVPALRGVDFAVEAGEVVAVVGQNGAGKTTLLRCVMGLLEPDEGIIELLGESVRALSTAELAKVVGFVPQDAGSMLFSDSVQEEISFTRRSHGLPADGREILATFELTPLAQQYPWNLSVGERQRVAIAAFLAGEPNLLLLDEPTHGLDYHQKAILASILRQRRAAGHAAVVVTHDVELVAAVADRMVILEAGQIVAQGPTAAVMRDHPEFASQISRLLGDRCLTAADAIRLAQAGLKSAVSPKLQEDSEAG